MGVALIIILFLSNALALDCLYNDRKKSAGALNILNLCLTVALAYQFEQMESIINIFLALVAGVAVFFGIRLFVKKKKKNAFIEGEIVEKEIEGKGDQDE